MSSVRAAVQHPPCAAAVIQGSWKSEAELPAAGMSKLEKLGSDLENVAGLDQVCINKFVFKASSNISS